MSRKINLLVLLLAVTLGIFSCKKDSKPDPFNTITLTEIKTLEPNFSNKSIVLTDANGNLVTKLGSIILFKTNKGVYGKFQIKSVKVPVDINNWEWVLEMVNFNADGSIALKKQVVDTQAEVFTDLDLGIANCPFNTSDFSTSFNAEAVKIIPSIHGATFWVYTK
jgi:hypothetical protein